MTPESQAMNNNKTEAVADACSWFITDDL